MPSFEEEDFNREIVILPKIKNLHKELIIENIRHQVEDPFDSVADFIQAFNDQVKEISDDNDITDEDSKDIRIAINSFYIEIIELISDKYQLECDIDTIADRGYVYIKECCEALYSFFILRYKKNIKNIFVNYILKNKKSIANALDPLKKKKDVTSLSLKKKVTDQDLALIISNLPDTLDYIKTLDIDMLRFIQFLNLDNFNIDLVNNLMLTSVIRPDFQVLYMEAVYNNFQDINYDDIIASIQRGIINNMKTK